MDRDEVARTLAWSPWLPLKESWLESRLPSLPGLYRIRRVGRQDLDYVGQTGAGDMTLKKRLGLLRGIYAAEMPYRAPHTAGPALWALRHGTACDFEASVVPIEGSTQWRKGWEAVAISLYRQDHGKSPTVEFGRMPAGYRMSSGNDAKLVAAEKRFRGGLTAAIDASHSPSLPPVGPLAGDPYAREWCGQRWSPWVPLSAVTSQIGTGAVGLYRIRSEGSTQLLYIGQGRVRARLCAHGQKVLAADHVQGQIFAGASRLECSCVLSESWLPHQLLELENDLIAAHIVATGAVPAAQFLG